MQKDFDKWNNLKKVTDSKENNFGVHEREIWWISLGLNVGVEIDGKHEFFQRPVLVVKRFNQQMVWVLPITSQKKKDYFHEKFLFENQEYFVALTQLRTVSTKRFLRKIGMMANTDFEAIKQRVIDFLHTNESPLASRQSRRPKP